MKNIRDFHLKIFSFIEVKFSIYLNRRVFVMKKSLFQKVLKTPYTVVIVETKRKTKPTK